MEKEKSEGMTLNEYQDRAMSTCMPTCDNFSYMMLNLVGEVGEFASKVAKGIRREEMIIGPMGWDENKGEVNSELLYINTSAEEVVVADYELEKEAGDILWQLAGLCRVMGWSLEQVADLNLEKLAARKAAGTIDGSGDGVTPQERGR